MTLTTMLLVGGESRRMGTDKATLILAGAPLWQRQLGVLRELTPDTLWISARTRPNWCPEDVEVIMDESPSRGPLSGMTAALSQLRTSHLFVLAIDMPRMTAAHIRKLLACVQPDHGIVPTNEKWLEPLCAIYPGAASEAAQRALSQGELSLQKFARTLCDENLLESYQIPDSEKPLYLNLNEPGHLSKERKDNMDDSTDRHG